VPNCVHFVKGEKGERQLTYHFIPLITAVKTNMLLIILLGLIANLPWVCDRCDVGNSEENNSDFFLERCRFGNNVKYTADEGKSHEEI